MVKRFAYLLRKLADKLDPPTVAAQSDSGGGGGPRERA